MAKFKLYENKSSLKKRRSRMLNGGTTEVKGNKLGWWERRTIDTDEPTDVVVTLTAEYDRRPDLVAYDYYGLINLTWLVLQYNNIVDIEEEFVEGKKILIPSRSRAITKFSNSSVRNDT